MSLRSRIILVDTNVIIEAHEKRVWRALSHELRLETVEFCVLETQTGAQNRRPERPINEAALRSSLRQIHDVSPLERATLLLRDDHAANIDDGERHLWAHAIGRSDPWMLCGPDGASLKLGIRLGLRDRLVALESLCLEAGCRPAMPLRRHYTREWHEKTVAQLSIQEGRWP